MADTNGNTKMASNTNNKLGANIKPISTPVPSSSKPVQPPQQANLKTNEANQPANNNASAQVPAQTQPQPVQNQQQAKPVQSVKQQSPVTQNSRPQQITNQAPVQRNQTGSMPVVPPQQQGQQQQQTAQQQVINQNRVTKGYKDFMSPKPLENSTIKYLIGAGIASAIFYIVTLVL